MSRKYFELNADYFERVGRHLIHEVTSNFRGKNIIIPILLDDGRVFNASCERPYWMEEVYKNGKFEGYKKIYKKQNPETK